MRTLINNKISFIIIPILLIYGCSTPTKNGDIKIGAGAGAGDGCWQSDFTSAEHSEYVLPYPVGKRYSVWQGNCGRFTHAQSAVFDGIDVGDNRYAYDFLTPIGSEVVASRSGQVVNAEGSYKYRVNDIRAQNFILIIHDDGTGAYYGHLTHEGVLVEVGDWVMQGDVIGLSGSTGYTYGLPHLHFAVYKEFSENCINLPGQDVKLSDCQTIPITFNNADPLDTPLRVSRSYKALDH